MKLVDVRSVVRYKRHAEDSEYDIDRSRGIGAGDGGSRGVVFGGRGSLPTLVPFDLVARSVRLRSKRFKAWTDRSGARGSGRPRFRPSCRPRARTIETPKINTAHIRFVRIMAR